jgi:hypothetical protein
LKKWRAGSMLRMQGIDSLGEAALTSSLLANRLAALTTGVLSVTAWLRQFVHTINPPKCFSYQNLNPLRKTISQ